MAIEMFSECKYMRSIEIFGDDVDRPFEAGRILDAGPSLGILFSGLCHFSVSFHDLRYGIWD